MQLHGELLLPLLHGLPVGEELGHDLNDGVFDGLLVGGADFAEEDAALVGESVGLVLLHLAVVLEVRLVAEEHELGIGVCVVDGLWEPIVLDALRR